MSWQESPLGMIADTQLGKMLDAKKNEGEYRPYLGNDNVQWDGIDLTEVKEMRIKDSELSKFALKAGDLLVCEGGDPGRCAIWNSDEEVYYQKALHRVRAHEDVLDNRFLYYYLVHICSTREICQYYTGGATIKHLPKAALERVVVRYPDLEAQRRIAAVLSAYDELIENNRKQIKLLEEAARRLYKEWFVDLKFPDHEITPVIDGLPEGWRRMPLSSLADYMNGFAFKPTDHFRDGYPIIKIKELQEGVMADTPRNSGTMVPAKYFVRTGDLIFSWSATLVAKLWPGEPGLLNQHLFKVNPANGIPKSYLVEAINASIPELVGFTTGSTMTHLQRNKLDRYLLAVPNEPILCKFDCICTPVHNAALNLDRQITAAREARDRLLPKLMSGEIEV